MYPVSQASRRQQRGASQPASMWVSQLARRTQYSIDIAMLATRSKLRETGRSAFASTLLAHCDSLRCRVRHPAGS